MFACPSCFIDDELISHINAQSTQSGNCDFCGSKHVRIIDTRELSDFYIRFIKAYKPFDNREENGEHLFTLITNDWDIFPPKCSYSFDLLNSIFKGFDNYDKIISQRYKHISLSNPLAEIGSSAIEIWSEFRNEMKTKNRYFISNKIDLALLKDIITNACSFTYKIDKIFYRARIAEDENGISINLMGKPPADKASPGRANPKGIAYLYLSSNKKTTLFETRSYVYDYVTIGDFQVLSPITVAKLQNLDKLSPFRIGEDIVGNFLALRAYLMVLEKELSKPVRRGDNELDYLPSQYLCEFIKAIGFDGVQYRSSLYEGGFNIALFNDDKIKCIQVETAQVKINDIEHEYIKKQ